MTTKLKGTKFQRRNTKPKESYKTTGEMVKHLLQKIQQTTWKLCPKSARLTELREAGFDVRVIDSIPMTCPVDQ